MMIPLRAMVRRDLRLFFADTRAVVLSFFAPIAIATFFGYIFGGLGGKAEITPIVVLLADQDGSVISREIGDKLRGDKTLDVRPATAEEARDAVRRGKAAVGIVLPKNFGAGAARAFFTAVKKPEVQFLYDPSRGAERTMVQGVLTSHVMQAVSKEVFTGKTGRDVLAEAIVLLQFTGGDPALRDLLSSVRKWNERSASAPPSGSTLASGGLTVPFTTHEESISAGKGASYNGYAHSFAGMGLQFILLTAIEVGVGVLLQRQRGLWKRMRAAPLSRTLLLGSRAVSSAIIAMMVLIVIFAFANIVLGVRIEGSMAGFLLIGLAFSLMTASFGLMVAGLGKTPDATRGIAIFFTLMMAMLGGAWVPMFIFPPWLQTVTLAIPTRWAMDGLDAMTWRGLDFSAAVAPILMTLLFTVVFGVIAVWRFRWDAD